MPESALDEPSSSSGSKTGKKSGRKSAARSTLQAGTTLETSASGFVAGRRATSAMMRGEDSALSGGDVEEILRARLGGVVNQLIISVSPGSLARALAAPSHISALGVLLDMFVQEHSELMALDPGATRQVRLAKARRELLERAGGTCSTSDAADLLDTTAGAVRKRLQRGTLLSYQTSSGEHRLPMAQFSAGGTVEGLEDVLQAMHVEDAWMRIQLFLDEDVLGALEDGRVEDAVRAVRSYLPTDEGKEK